MSNSFFVLYRDKFTIIFSSYLYLKNIKASAKIIIIEIISFVVLNFFIAASFFLSRKLYAFIYNINISHEIIDVKYKPKKFFI